MTEREREWRRREYERIVRLSQAPFGCLTWGLVFLGFLLLVYWPK